MGKQFMGGIASDVVKRTDHSHHVAQVVDAEPAVVGITGLADYTKKYEIKRRVIPCQEKQCRQKPPRPLGVHLLKEISRRLTA